MGELRQLQASGISQLAKRLLGMTSDQAPKVLDVAALYPYVELGRRMEPDLLFDQGIFPWAVGTTQVADAGNPTVISLFGAPGYLTVVMGADVTLSTLAGTAAWHLGLSLASATGLFEVCVDGRFYGPSDALVALGSVQAPVGVRGSGALAANAQRLYKGILPTLAGHPPLSLPYPVVLGPDTNGVGLLFQTSAVNTGVDYNAWGYSLRVKPA